METEFIKRLHSARLTRGEVRALAAQLPATDEALRQLIESRVASADETGVTMLMLAMVAGGRSIEARVLPGVLPLMNQLDGVSLVALQARGAKGMLLWVLSENRHGRQFYEMLDKSR